MKSKKNWIPNALTLGNLTLGFVSILIASKADSLNPETYHYFVSSSFFIMIAFVLDGLDGAVARLISATSEIGADLDSLADLTTFGIAPSFLIYKLFLIEYKFDVKWIERDIPLGIFIASIYPICAAYRLARFNVSHNSSSFTGLPSPIAGFSLAILPAVLRLTDIPKILILFEFIVLSILMVSNIKYKKPQIAIRKDLSLVRLILSVFAIAFIFYLLKSKWPFLIFGLMLYYIFSGLVSFIIQYIQKFRVKL